MHTKYAANTKARNTEFIHPYKTGKLETTTDDCHWLVQIKLVHFVVMAVLVCQSTLAQVEILSQLSGEFNDILVSLSCILCLVLIRKC